MAAAAATGVLAVAVAAAIAWKSAVLIALVFLAILVAIPLNRAVGSFQRAGIPRPAGIALVVVALLALLTAGAIYVVRPAAVQLAQLVAATPDLLEALRRSGRLAELGRALGDAGLLEKLRDTAPAVAQELLGGAVGAASGVAGALSALATVLVTAVLLLAAGPAFA
jgi:predicted PurR-regulated permease PerM